MKQRAGRAPTYLMLAILVFGVAIMTRFHSSTWAALPLGMIIAVVAIPVTLAVAVATRCPRCHTPLGKAGVSLMWKNPANSCPTCGIHFDEPARTE